MPGPGGGSRGGGGGSRGGGGGSRGGGSFGGGSRGGGGFGGGGPGGRPGGFHGGHPGGMHWGGMHMGWGPRRHYGVGGGCLGSLFSIVLVVLFLVFFLVWMLIPSQGMIIQLGSVYDEGTFQDYANSQYAAEFGDAASYEDNLLIVFLIDENYQDYYYIAWVGDHIVTDINYMLGNNYTELGQAMSQCINQSSYKYSLDSNLAQVMQIMEKAIGELGLETSFTCSESHSETDSYLVNYTELELTEATVNDALLAFSDATDIPVVIVVEDTADVFGTYEAADSTGPSVVTVLIVVALIVVIVVLLVKNRGSKKREDTSDERYSDKRYADFDDQYK